MELGGVRDLEQHVLHHIAAIPLMERELVALEQHVVEAPLGGAQHAGIPHLAAHGDEGQAHRAGRRIPRCPALARTGVRRVAIGAQALAIDPGLGDGIDHLIPGAPQHMGHHGGAGYLDQHHVIQAHPVEGVLKRQDTLNFMGLHHGHQHIGHGQRRLALGHASTGEPVGGGQDPPQIVRGVSPLGSEPGVVVVEPADDGAYVPGRLDRIEAKLGAWHPGTKGDDSTGHYGAQVLGTLGKAQGQQATAQGIHQAVAGGVEGRLAGNGVAADVIGNIDQYLVRIGSVVDVDVGGHRDFLIVVVERQSDGGPGRHNRRSGG